MKYIYKYLIGIVIAGALFSCIKDEYNINPYEPGKVPALKLLPPMFQILASPQQNSCQQNNTMWACFSGHVTTPTTWQRGSNVFAYFNADEGFNEGTYNDFFVKVYSNYFNIEIITQKEGLAYSLALMTRVHAMQAIASLQGPIPYSKMEGGKLSIPYDDEETAWHAMFADLNDAISIMEVHERGGVDVKLAEVDQFYNGDIRKWIKFSNTLKLRMALRISGIDPVFAKQMATEAVLGGVMESVDDSAYDNTNSGYSNNGYSIIDNWGELRANACLVSYMNGYNDPRRATYFTEQEHNNSGGYLGVRSGTTTYPSTSTYTNYSHLRIGLQENKTMAQPVMYAAEAAFLRAEGASKGWEAEMGGTAKEFYEKGIRLSFEENNVSGIDAYLADNSSLPGNHVDPVSGSDSYTNKSKIKIQWDDSASADEKLERIVTQKWIACFLDPIGGWADFRRTGYPQIFPPTSSASRYGVGLVRQQRRLHFGQKEYNTNKANTLAAIPLLSNGQDSDNTDLWWALKATGGY